MRAPEHETPAERASRRDARYGLADDQLNVAFFWSGAEVAFLVGLAASDGLACRHVGRALGQLQALGFVEIEANGQSHRTAKLTRDGLKALVFKMAKLQSGSPRPL